MVNPATLQRSLFLSLLLMFGFTKLFGQQQMDDFPPKPKWRPNLWVDIETVAQKAAYYTNHQKTIIIFKNGTCVVLPSDTPNAKIEANEVLKKVFNYHPDFNPLSMDDGNYLVTFSQSNCFAVVLRSEFEKNKEYIVKNHLDGVVKNEVLLNAEKKQNVFDERGMIGLFGRARMFMDCENPVVVKIIEPQ